MTRRVLYYLIIDAIADFRAEWGKAIIIIRQHLWSMYDDERQMIQLIEADARAALKRAKQGGQY